MESNDIVDLTPEYRQPTPGHRRDLRFLICCLFGIVLLVSAIYFGPQTITYFRFRSAMLRPADYPPRGWSSVPGPLRDTTASTAEGSTISFGDHQFDAPWKESQQEQQGTRIHFETGQIIEFSDFDSTNVDPIDPQILHSNRADFANAFGTGIFPSKYDQYQAILSVKPSDWSPLRSRREFARFQFLLEIKGLWFEHNVTAPEIFSFETNNYRGFELSGLSHDWQNVIVNWFDAADHRFQINVRGNARSDVRITQPEVNRIIQSFRLTQPPPPSN
jgi:hypothetical protein